MMTDPALAYAQRLTAAHRLRLVDVLTSPAWMGLATASPLQRALCAWAEGVSAGWPPVREDGYDADVRARMTSAWCVGAMPTVRPTEVYLLAGIRCGKSLLAAAVAVWASQTVDVSGLRPGERCRFSVLSLDKDKARAVLMHLHGAVESSPAIRELVVGEVRADGLDLRHPSGTVVEVRVVAGRRAGGGLVSYWSAGVVFDEAPRMLGDDEAVVNFDDSRKAVLARLLPGAQLWAIGSPWAPLGPVYDAVQEHHGKPGQVLVVRAPAPAMNPVTWTPDACERIRRTDLATYRMDVLGEWGDAETGMFHDVELRAVMRTDRLELLPAQGEHCVAAMDPATRGNAWTLGIAAIRRDTGLPTLMHAKQWMPTGEPLDPARVLDEVAGLMRSFGCRAVYTDQFSGDFIIAMARERGLHVVVEPWTAQSKRLLFDDLADKVRARRVQLADVPQLADDLKRTRRRLTQAGASIVLPQTADGRHCDYAPMLAQLFGLPMQAPDPLPLAESAAEAAERKYIEDLERKVRRDDGGIFTERAVFG